MPKLLPVATRILAGSLVLALASSGCATGASPVADSGDPVPVSNEDRRPVVATTFTILADMTRRIGGERIRVESLISPGADVHQIEPTAGDLVRVEDADLIVSNGLGLDEWLLRFLDGTGANHVEASAGIDPLPIRTGNHTDRPNPHAWMSPAAGQKYVHTIARALTELDPAGAAEYETRARNYSAEIAELGMRATQAVDALPEAHRVLVTCEGAFSYLARDLDLDELYLWPVNAESQGLPRQVAALIDEVRQREVPAVFCESTVSGAAMEQVSAQTGSPLAGTLYVDSLSTPTGPVPTYLDLLEHDLEAITTELTP